jgi:predicted metal-binding membrane protein
MSAILRIRRQPKAEALQYFFWRHPEWWSQALCYFAWALLLLQGWQHLGGEIHHQMTSSHETTGWMLMVAAMMLPFEVYRIWLTAASSLWARRHRAIAGYLVGYFAPWLLVSFVIAMLRQAWWTHTNITAGLCFMGAAVWQLTPMHKAGLITCHRTVALAPVGWRADRDCVRFGGMIGIICLWICWPLMLACALAGHSLIAITGGMLVSFCERKWYRRRMMLLGTLALAAYYILLAVMA